MPARDRMGDVTELCFKLVEMVPLDISKNYVIQVGWVVPSWDIVCIGWLSGPYQYSRYSILPPLDGVRRGVRWYLVLYKEWSLVKSALFWLLRSLYDNKQDILLSLNFKYVWILLKWLCKRLCIFVLLLLLLKWCIHIAW